MGVRFDAVGGLASLDPWFRVYTVSGRGCRASGSECFGFRASGPEGLECQHFDAAFDFRASGSSGFGFRVLGIGLNNFGVSGMTTLLSESGVWGRRVRV